MANFDGTDEYFDSREVIERIAELTAEFIDATDSDPADYMSEDDWRLGLSDDDAEELTDLIALQEEAEGYIPDWQYGETFISADYFADYAYELCKDVGYLPADLPGWIENHIDWEGVADELKVDYQEFEFRGTTYYAR